MMIISTTRQIQHIADLLTGQTSDIDPDHLTQPWRRYHDWIQNWIRGWEEYEEEAIDYELLKTEFNTQLGGLGGEHSDRENIARIFHAIHHPVTYPSMADIFDDLPNLEWLWPGWIPRKMLTVLAAEAGSGKSYVGLDLARRIINGTSFPDDSPIVEPGTVVLADSENTPSIYKQRVRIWTRKELDRLYYMLPGGDTSGINLDDEADRERLLDRICVVHPALVILDSYGSATFRADRNKEDVQELLTYLNRIANDHALAMLLIHHLRKRSAGQESFLPITLDSIKGSSYIVYTARSIIGLQTMSVDGQPDKKGPRQLWVMKSSAGQEPPPMGVTLRPHPDDPEVAQLEYGDPPVPYREPTKVEECEIWLAELLKEAGQLKPGDIVAEGDELGYNRRMVYRARKRLGDRIGDTEDSHRHPDNHWKWLSDDANSEE